MGKYMCICGNIVSDVCIPDTNLGYLKSSWDSEDEMNERERTVHQCDKCGTLAIEHPMGSNNHKFYSPVDKINENLFQRILEKD